MNKTDSSIKNDFNPSSTILTKDDLVLLNGVESYRKSIQKDCADMMEATKSECAQLIEETKKECAKLRRDKLKEMDTILTDLSNYLKEENYELINKFCKTIEDGIFTLCYKIIAKLNISAVANDQLLKLIQEEITEYTQEKQITVQANSKNVEYLKQTLVLYGKQISYISKDTLTKSQCIVSDGFVTIYANITRCADEIIHLLDETIKHNE